MTTLPCRATWTRTRVGGGKSSSVIVAGKVSCCSVIRRPRMRDLPADPLSQLCTGGVHATCGVPLSLSVLTLS